MGVTGGTADVRGRAVALLALVSLLGCGETKPPSPPPAAAAPVAPAVPAFADREWELVVLGQATPPPSGRPVTMRFDSGSRRAAGSAGCNRYSAAYTMRGEGLTFGPAAATKMACPDGMEFEGSFFGMLTQVTTYEVTGSTLVLRGVDGSLARFEAR
jgi:heat shock protein HslJ